ncbi:MAG: hypothetical protein QNK23_12090 [Crocinitomicaceae bacterium]|nr:hypothetical protein [Crocinitomicaceae bacterium]
MRNQSKVALLGADKFILALEHHDRHLGTSGNTCRYILDLDEGFDLHSFKEALNSNEIVRWLSNMKLSSKLDNSNHWTQGESRAINLTELHSNSSLPIELLEIKQNCYTAPLFYFHLIHRMNGTRSLIFSWHHLLMDGYGASLFLKNLVEPQTIERTEKTRSPFTFGVFREMVKAKRYISRSAKGKINTIETKFKKEVQQTYRIIPFTAEETSKIDKQAIAHGAKFGQGAFLLSSAANCVNKFLVKNGKSSQDFWVPVPQDSRKRGSNWPVLGNHLSFLFYRIDKAHLGDKKACIESLNAQMMGQIKAGIPTAYGHLMNYLRRIPSPLYTRLIKGPNGKSLSSFLFTVAAEYPKDLIPFFGGKVLNAISVPPNTYPPGLTFAFNRFEGKLQIVVLSYAHLMSDQDFKEMEDSLRNELLDITSSN